MKKPVLTPMEPLSSEQFYKLRNARWATAFSEDYDLPIKLQTLLRSPQRREQVFERIIPDKLYKPAEVAHILSVSYNTALRVMGRTSRTIDLAKGRVKKRLPRIRGLDLRKYLDGKVK